MSRYVSSSSSSSRCPLPFPVPHPLYGSDIHIAVRVQLALPDIPVLPLFSDIPYIITVTTTSAPLAREKASADKATFPPLPRDPHELEFEVPIERSSWVALRIYPSSHTNPIFVIVDGKPIRASKKSAEWCLKSVDQCWSQKQNAIRPDERPAAKQAYDVARDAYRKVLAESAVD